LIDPAVSVIEPEFTFFEVQVEEFLVHAAELRQAAFREAPEAIDAVDGHDPAHELIAPRSDFEEPAVPHIHQAIIATPAVRGQHTVQAYPPADKGLQRGFLTVRHDLGGHLAVAVEQTEDDGFAEGAAPAPAPHAARTEGRFINFNVAAHRLDLIAVPSHAPAQRSQMAVDGHTAETGQGGYLHGVQVEREQPHNVAEFRLGDSRMENISIRH